MKVCITLGTRPEIIKLAPVIKELQRNSIDFFIIHSNQHYSENMDAIFFKDFDLPAPKYNLNIGSGGHSLQTGSILVKIEPILMEEKPDWMIVQGDTNTVLAGALAAHKLGIKVAHVEAGLRSYDKTMPEESNRILTDHMSDLLFAVTETQKNILKLESVDLNKVHVVGNTIVDAVMSNVSKARDTSDVLKRYNLSPKNYALMTCHRSGNVDNKFELQEIIDLVSELDQTVCWPVHVRTQKKLKEFAIEIPSNLLVVEPQSYHDFLMLESEAKFIVTDSGGVQEEACILGVPCLTIRNNTERPETVNVGANVIVKRDKSLVRQALKNLPTDWVNPYGNGDTSQQIVQAISQDYQATSRKDKICVVGLGYMGLPTSLLFAKEGYSVSGFDINEDKISKLNQGVCPFDETGLPDLLTNVLETGRFKAYSKVIPSDIYVIAVPTPHENSKCDLTYVIKAAKSVAEVVKDGDMVIIESTIKPRTCTDYVLPIFEKIGKRIDLVHCPERAIPGETLKEIVNNDRIIGASSEKAKQRAKYLYKSFVKGEIFTTDLVTAECVKLMENTFRDVNIALANEFSMLADELGFNVWEAIKLANRHPRVNILQPGPGVGGHCIAIDPWFLVEDTKSAKLIKTAREINDKMPSVVVDRLLKKNDFKEGIKVGVLGVAYKKNVDDARETPAEHIIEILKKKGCEVVAHDPHVQDWVMPIEKDLNKVMSWAESIILVTDHDEYNFVKRSENFLDTRGGER
jgi:UDP-N-acetylglucosamine 2-epimerase (non-hydrolysing)